MKCNRRQFLGIMGATAAGVGLAGTLSAKISETADDDMWRDRTEEYIPSICQLCPGGCGLNVRVVAGVPVKVDGNPLHPISRGALCPRGLAALQSLYNPDRLVAPLRRVGEKGSKKWEEISWDEALQMLVTAMMKLRQRGTPEALAILGGEYRGMLDRLWDRFARTYGTPNYLRLRTHQPELPSPVGALMHGEPRALSFDLHETALVLSFGCDWLESWISPVFQLRAYGHMRQGRRGHRADILHVGSRFSQTAAKADLWIPIKPGTEGTFAMGIAHLILREQIYDQDFVERNTFGFEDWQGPDGRTHRGFKRLALDEYTPARVSEITDVRPEILVTVARRFASARPAIALGDNRSLLEGHDLFTRMAIHSLNALVGSIGVQGGVLPAMSGPPFAPWPEISTDTIGEEGLARARLDGAGMAERFLDADVPRGLHEAVLRAESSPVEILILHRANPLYGRPDKAQFRKAFGKIPLVVSLSNVPDEATSSSDLILPEHHFLEGWQDDVVTHLPGFTLFSIGLPVARPLYNTRHAADFILDLAKVMGTPMADAFPWGSYEDLLHSTSKGLFEADTGYIASTPSDEMFRKVLQREGYHVGEFENFEEFWQALKSNGAWWDPVEPLESARRRYRTLSGKFEFYSHELEARLHDAALSGAPDKRLAQEERRRLLSALGVRTVKEELFFPELLPLTDESAGAEFPFLLQTYELLTIGHGIGANLPWLQENLAAQFTESWESWIEIHPDAARAVNVRDGEWVWVESLLGRVRVRARLNSGTRRDVVSMPVGQGHTSGGRWARGRGVDPSDLVVSTTEPEEGFGIRKKTWVRIERA